MTARRRGALALTTACGTVGGILLPLLSAWGAESFPVKGTYKADTIEVQKLLTNSAGTVLVVKVEINGEVTNYSWKQDRADRVIEAGAGDDHITISVDAGFVIKGEGGDDTIQGGEEKDVILGGSGEDTIKGGNGNDWITGDPGKDHLEGGPGNDVIYGNEYDDVIRGGVGNDLIDGGTGDDELWGEDGDDMLYGEMGSDKVRGGDGNDLLCGGPGNDKLRGDAGDDILLGEDGSDTLEDTPVVTESQYEANREKLMQEVEDAFGVKVTDYGRKWMPVEVGYLREALELLPDKVLGMFGNKATRLNYHRKEIFSLAALHPFAEEYSASGLQNPGTGNIWLYDLLWGRDSGDVQNKWHLATVHETGHAYWYSGSMSEALKSGFKDLSGWQGSSSSSSAHFVTDYAMTNASEEWAESFAYYGVDPLTLQTEAAGKYDFLNEMFGMYGNQESFPVARPQRPGRPARPGPRPWVTRPRPGGRLRLP